LVTDLPADFEVFGQAVDTSMADLKGGTTGQILSKATNTDMDFTWITNDVGDITGVTATSPLTGGGTSGAITVGIQDATTSVKGSVQLSDSTSTTSSVLAATPTAVKSAYDLAALASPAAAAFYAGKNRVLNGSMSVWQRGTSFTYSGSNAYFADRWCGYNNGTSLTITRQATNDSTNLPNIQYCARVARNAASTNVNANSIVQSFESVNSIPLAGKAVVISFYARAGANYSPASSALGIIGASGTGTDQNFLSGYTGSAYFVNSSATLTTTWQRFTFTGTVPATSTEQAVYFYATPVGTAGAADYYEVTGVQLEVGSTASPYAPNGATYQGELAACQRYYNRENYTVATGSQHNAVGINTTLADTCITFPTQMRVTPTALDIANVQIYNYITAGGYTTGSFSIASFSSPQTAVLRYTHGSAVFTAATNYGLAGTATAGYVGFSAEL
jgi:hypothetical protein